MSPADDVFDKLDTLLNKHRPAPTPLQNARDENQIPVLTEEIQLEALATQPLPVLMDEVIDSDTPGADAAPPLNAPETLGGTSTPPTPDQARSAPTQALPSHHLEQFILETVERRIAPKLASKLDLALGELLEQFKGEIETLVKQAIAQEMQQYLESFEQDLSRHSPSDTPH